MRAGLLFRAPCDRFSFTFRPLSGAAVSGRAVWHTVVLVSPSILACFFTFCSNTAPLHPGRNVHPAFPALPSNSWLPRGAVGSVATPERRRRRRGGRVATLRWRRRPAIAFPPFAHPDSRHTSDYPRMREKCVQLIGKTGTPLENIPNLFSPKKRLTT